MTKTEQRLLEQLHETDFGIPIYGRREISAAYKLHAAGHGHFKNDSRMVQVRGDGYYRMEMSFEDRLLVIKTPTPAQATDRQ